MGITYDYIDAKELDECRKYPSILHRGYGKIIQVFTGDRRDWGRENFIRSKLKGKAYDRSLVIIPAMLNREIVRDIRSHAKKINCVLWDSLSKEPASKRVIGLFDSVFSFDIEDVKLSFDSVLIEHLPTYILEPNESQVDEGEFDYDVCGYFRVKGKEDIRSRGILDFAKKNKLRGKIYFVCSDIDESSEKHDGFDIIYRKSNLSIDDKYNLIRNSKAILDFVDPRQKGISPRLGDAYQFNKLLVTNNKTIMDDDWFLDNVIIFDSYGEIQSGSIHSKYKFSKSPRGLERWINTALR